MFLLLHTMVVYAENQPDYLGYPKDSTVRTYINWQSFEDNGIPSDWKQAFEDIVINTYTRWTQVGGFRLNPQFWGYTTKTKPESGEIIIWMNEMHASPCAEAKNCDDRLASRFSNPAMIVFHRKSRITGTPWNFVPHRPRDGEYDMMAILMHEMGHAFGLEHNTDGAERSVMGGYHFADRYGPFQDDIKDVRALYGAKTNRRFKIKRSDNSGASWSDWDTNLTSLGVTTSMGPTATRDPERTILYYTHHNKHPAFIHGDNSGANFDDEKLLVFGGQRSVYGTAGHGYDDEYMISWVDDHDNHRVKVAYSSDGGIGYAWRNPPLSKSYGTPAIHKVFDDTWILAYSRFDRDDLNENGKIVVRVSTNNGVNWGPEVVLHSSYRAASGVTVTSNGRDEIRIGFSWDKRTTGTNFLKRTIVAHLSGNELVYDQMIYEYEKTRTQPVFTKTFGGFVEAWREVNFLTSINTRSSEEASTLWLNYVRAVESSAITPTLSAYREWGASFLYYLED